MPTRMRLDRAAVVQAAAALADAKGLEKLTLASLAAQLGIRTPSLYNHINGLAGLRRELALYGMHALSQRMGRVVMGKAADEAISALANEYRSFAKEHPGLYAATYQSPSPNEPELQAVASDIITIILQVLAPYGLHDEAALHTIRAFRSIIHGFTGLEANNGFGLPLELDESFRILITLFLSGLHAAAAGPPRG